MSRSPTRSLGTLHSSNNPASLTSRLGASIDVEQNHVRFLGDLILNLWDCGGQDAFMDSYPSTQRSTIFQHVGVLIYVFEASAHDAAKDAEYYRDCLDALQKYSPEAAVLLLGTSIHDETPYKVRHPPTSCLTRLSRFLAPSPPLSPSTPHV
jgi:Ras-related GTP-binding protein A/B